MGPAPHRSENRPLHVERIRRSWEVGECVAVRPVVRLVVRPGRIVEPEPYRSEDVWRGWDEILRYAQDDRRGKQVRRVGVEVGVIRADRVRGRVGGQAGRDSRGCR